MRAPIVLVIAFAVLIAFGTLVLTLPVANRAGVITPAHIALFTSTSAVCITGLTVVDTFDYWSPFGQAFILLLIQFGGLGIVTSTTFLWMLAGHNVGLSERVLLSETQGGGALGGVIKLGQDVLRVTLLIELLGALVLTLRFALDYEWGSALWLGVFHSVSAYNNAGFDIIGGSRSLIPFNDDPLIILTAAVMIIFGSISYLTVVDVARKRRFRRLTLESKMVLSTTAFLIVGGTIGYLLFEWANPATLGPMTPATKLMNAFFSSVSLRSCGFTSLSIPNMMYASLFLTLFLMFVGGATGSVAGGMKVNTLAVLISTTIASARGRRVATAFGRELSQDQVYRAGTVAFLSLTAVFLLSLSLMALENQQPIDVLFEAFSAFGTVGASTGASAQVSVLGQMLLSLAMYVGRLGPLTLALALVARSRATSINYPSGEIRVG